MIYFDITIQTFAVFGEKKYFILAKAALIWSKIQ